MRSKMKINCIYNDSKNLRSSLSTMRRINLAQHSIAIANVEESIGSSWSSEPHLFYIVDVQTDDNEALSATIEKGRDVSLLKDAISQIVP